MAENLKKTLNIDGTEYNINAVYSDEAGKVTNPLIVKRSGNAAFNFDGSVAGQTIDYVPTAGGTFSGKVYIDHSNAQDKDLGSVTDNELINYDQIKHLVCDLAKHPLHSWESNQLTQLKTVHNSLSGLNVVVGTTEEFKAFKRLMGVPDITSTDEETRYYGLRISSSTPYTEGHVDYRTRTNRTYTDVYLPSYGYYNELSTGIIDLSKGVPVTTIREKAFENNTTIEMVEIPESITTIGSNAFSGCSALKSIKLPSKLERLNTETFKGCTNLKSIVIGKNVKKISRDVFKSCSNLKTVYYEGTEDDWLAFNKVDTITYTDDTKQINNTGNTALTDVYTKSKAGEDGYSFIFNYTYTTEFIDLPCLYICTDFGTNNLNTDNVNKMFLKMPNTGIFVELSRSATYLESPVGATTSGYYTYETLAAIIAGINSRLAALGGSDKYVLELPTVLPETEHVLIPDTIISDKILEVPENVPSVQDLEEDIDNLKIELLDGVAGNYVTKTVGGISAGSQIDENITVSNLLKQILGISTGVAPSGFSFTISPTSITADLNATSQDITATWSVSNGGTYTGNYTPTIGGVTGTAAGKSGSTIDITVTFTEADTSKSVSGSATYAAGTGFNAGTLNGGSKSLTINRTCYYGPSSGTLSSTARTTKNNWTINQNTALENDYFVIQYPKAWGTLSSITDNDTGYEAVADSQTFNNTPTEITKNGGAYYQYRTNNKLSSKLSFTINS